MFLNILLLLYTMILHGVTFSLLWFAKFKPQSTLKNAEDILYSIVSNIQILFLTLYVKISKYTQLSSMEICFQL